VELLDIRDENGVMTGMQLERGRPLRDGQYVLVVHVYIYNRAGEFLLQKRSRLKEMYPGRWDITGGGVIAGESSKEAALREVGEELGVELRGGLLQSIARLKWNFYLIDVWACRTDIRIEDIVMQPEEVDDVKYVSSADMMDIVFGNEFENKEYQKIIGDFIRTLGKNAEE
jgi:isopentenyldiphosphate isomerase